MYPAPVRGSRMVIRKCLEAMQPKEQKGKESAWEDGRKACPSRGTRVPGGPEA